MAATRKMTAPVVKLKPTTHAKLLELSKTEARPMGEIVTDLVERYEVERFWNRLNEQYVRLKADPAVWQDYKDEIALLEGGSMDGLGDEEPYFTAEEEREIRNRIGESGA